MVRMIVGVRHRSPNLRAIIPNLASPTTPSTYFLLSPARTSNSNDAMKGRGMGLILTPILLFLPPISLLPLLPFPFRKHIPPRCPCTPFPTLRTYIPFPSRASRAFLWPYNIHIPIQTARTDSPANIRTEYCNGLDTTYQCIYGREATHGTC